MVAFLGVERQKIAPLATSLVFWHISWIFAMRAVTDWDFVEFDVLLNPILLFQLPVTGLKLL